MIDDGGGLYDLEARALPSGSFWSTATPVAFPPFLPSMPVPVDIRQAFATAWFFEVVDGAVSATTGRMTWKKFDPIPVDGAELRVTWSSAVSTATTMQGALLNLARHNRAPMIGPVRLRCQASSQVLSVEAAR